MFILFFIVLIIQFFNYWLFHPLINFLTHLIEIKFLPLILLSIFIFSFQQKIIQDYKNAG